MQLENTLVKIFNQFGIDHIGNWDKFIALGHIKTFRKGEVIKDAYQIEKNLNIIIEGTAAATIWVDNNTPKCIDLYFNNQFFMDYHSFINQEPTPIKTQLLSDSKLFIVPYKSFIKLLNSSPIGDKVTRIITDFHFSHKQKQQIDLLTKSSLERLNDLIKQYPDIINRVPKKTIASYLGITPQSLSRIMKIKEG